MNTIILATLLTLAAPIGQAEEIAPVSFAEVTIDDSFWSPRLKAHKDVTLGVCIDQIENQTGRIRNFENAAGGEGTHSGIFFDDSDVYKALEGMAYALRNNHDPKLEEKCDEWIDKFAAAQQSDGYLNTYYTLTGLQNRWTDMDKHEMYCAGHMIEAAVAYYDVTGKRKLLDVCERFVAHMMSVFGPGRRDWVPGHEEIELALVKLYDVTGKREYIEFAQWLLEERGHGFGRMMKNGESVTWPGPVRQDAVPVREITDIEGHAVRAMYLYCGMADVAAHTGDTAYMAVLERLWNIVTSSKMYITGGIGSVRSYEGFGKPYSLPNLDAYCETCASVGMVLWNWRMNRLSGDAKYIDILEKNLYNGVLSGISLEGDRFFYVNPLESLGDHHRKSWYGCACCPSQLCRFLPSIGNYIYGISDHALWVNTFIGNKSDYMSITTLYPWDGNVSMTVGKTASDKKEIRVRIPGWCHKWSLSLRGIGINPRIEKGYAVIDGPFREGDEILLNMDMPVEIVAADSRVADDRGKRAVQRGPVIYCLEEVDNPSIETAYFDGKPLKASFDQSLLGGVIKIDSDNLHFVPYYSWDNRGAGRMKVWVNYPEALASETNPTFSPDSSMVAFTRGNDLWVRTVADSVETRITTDGSFDILNGYASWVYYEEIFGRASKYKAFWWSPDSKKIAFMRFDNTGVALFPIYSPAGQNGSVNQTRYPKAGQVNPSVRTGIADLQTSNVVWADFDRSRDQYFGTPFWSDDSQKLYVQRVPRRQNKLDLYAIDSRDGAKTRVYHEEYPTWVEFIDGMLFDDNGFYMARDFESGWQQIYHLSYDGSLKCLTAGENWDISLLACNNKNGSLWFLARRDSRLHQSVYRLDRNGRIILLSDPEKWIKNVRMSSDNKSFVCDESTAREPWRNVRYSAVGKSAELLEVVTGAKELSEECPLPQIIKIQNDGFDLYGLITYPKDFDPAKKYPVVMEVYGGPGTAYVRDRWQDRDASNRWCWENGVIWMCVDSRSSGENGRRGMDQAFRRMTVIELQDYIAWAKYMQSQPYVDGSRIGVDGFSFGGTTTAMLVLRYPQYFSCGISGGGVYDWTLYDSAYTERFMDTPQSNPEGYSEASVLSFLNPDDLKISSGYKPGSLKLTHGTGDDNVHFQNTLQLIDALQKAGLQFQLMIYPDGMHGYRDAQKKHDNADAAAFWKQQFGL